MADKEPTTYQPYEQDAPNPNGFHRGILSLENEGVRRCSALCRCLRSARLPPAARHAPSRAPCPRSSAASARPAAGQDRHQRAQERPKTAPRGGSSRSRSRNNNVFKVAMFFTCFDPRPPT